MFEKNFTCCFTGHRDIKPKHEPLMNKALEISLRALIADGYFIFAVGGALGFDTLAAEAVLSMKKEFPQIRLAVVAPCADQTDSWKESDKRRYERIREAADEYICMSAKYTSDCMKKRNRCLVDMSAACVCYCLHERSGTAQTVGFAKEQAAQIIDIVPLLESIEIQFC